jgi:hypothetical protein
MTLCDGPVDILLVVGSIAAEGGEWTGDLVKQCLDLRAIIGITGRQLRCQDLFGLSINANVEFSPGPASLSTVFFHQPLAGSAQT